MTVLQLEKRLGELKSEADKIKTTINCLCEVMGEQPKYVLDDTGSGKAPPPRPDQYFGRPLATVVTEAMQKRQAYNLGAATLDELYQELIAGAFEFVGKDDGIKKRGLAIAMGKNQKFTRLPNDTWGLSEWYPEAGRGRSRKVLLQDENNGANGSTRKNGVTETPGTDDSPPAMAKTVEEASKDEKDTHVKEQADVQRQAAEDITAEEA